MTSQIQGVFDKYMYAQLSFTFVFFCWTNHLLQFKQFLFVLYFLGDRKHWKVGPRMYKNTSKNLFFYIKTAKGWSSYVSKYFQHSFSFWKTYCDISPNLWLVCKKELNLKHVYLETGVYFIYLKSIAIQIQCGILYSVWNTFSSILFPCFCYILCYKRLGCCNT